MRVSFAVVVLVAGCSRTASQPAASARDASPAPPADPVAKNWKIELTGQFFGTALGPLNQIAVDSGGAITVKVDGKVIGSGSLPPGELERLSRLVGDPKLVAAQTPDKGPDVGQHTTIKVTGDVTLNLVGPSPETGPLIAEVDRLRDLVAPPEDFKLALREGATEIRQSSNGYLEILRDGKQVANHFYPMSSLDLLRRHLALPELRGAASPGGNQARLTVTGDLALDLAFPGPVTGPARPVADEMRRLAALVEASKTPPRSFTLVYRRQEHGAGLGPARTITVKSTDRSITLMEEGVKGTKRRILTEPELTGLARALVDPAFRSATPTPPSSEGMHFQLQITGDQPMDVTYQVDVPPPVTTVINHIDSLSDRAGP